MGATVAVCIPVLNDLESLRIGLPYTKKWADQIVILDSGSTDGGLEFLRWYLDPTDKLIERPDNIEDGMADLRNWAAEAANTDWIFAMDADCFLRPSDKDRVRGLLSLAGPVFQVTRLMPEYSPKFKLWQAEQALETLQINSEIQHWLYRKDSGYGFRGYIHEGLIRGENKSTKAEPSGIAIYHLATIKGPAKAARSAYRLKKVVASPELQFWVDPHWYIHHYQENKELMDTLAKQYAAEHGLPEL